MKRITLYCRTTSARGTTNLRFRVTDGRNLTMYYSTGRKIPNEQLTAFTSDGTVKSEITEYNARLKEEIEKYMAAIDTAYSHMKMTGMAMHSDVLQAEVDKVMNPETPEAILHPNGKENLVQRFRRYIEEAFRDGIIGEHRHMHYDAICRRMERFLTIRGFSNLMPEQFDVNMLMDYRAFIADEYLYVSRYPKIYVKNGRKRYPTRKISNNSVVHEMTALRAFFSELETSEELFKSPFRRISRERFKTIMRRTSDEPFFLRQSEYKKVLETEAPPELQTAKDIFILNCCTGARIGDFRKFSMDRIAVSPEGIPYIQYIPYKTMKEMEAISEIRTPLVRTAYDIVMRTKFGFNFQETNYSVAVYNRELRKLLKHCGIDRKVPKFNAATGANEYLPIYEIAGSRLARKTYLYTVSQMEDTPYTVHPDLTLVKRGRPKQAPQTAEKEAPTTSEYVLTRPRRGRPRKMKEDGTTTSSQTMTADSSTSSTATQSEPQKKRGPGRPRKERSVEAAPKRGPGRPRKERPVEDTPKRRPGRPRKNP
jgi:hypothetical protein